MARSKPTPEIIVRFVRVTRAFIASVFGCVAAELYLNLGRAVGTLPSLLSSLPDSSIHRLSNFTSAAAFIVVLFVPSLYADLKRWRTYGGRPLSLLTMVEIGVVAAAFLPIVGSAEPGASVNRTVGVFTHAAQSLGPVAAASIAYLLMPYIWAVLVFFVLRLRPEVDPASLSRASTTPPPPPTDARLQ